VQATAHDVPPQDPISAVAVVDGTTYSIPTETISEFAGAVEAVIGPPSCVSGSLRAGS
jgi:hypothetical protein